MARISGVNIPAGKRAIIAVTYIHGIGRTRAEAICRKCNIDFSARVQDLSNEQIAKMRTVIEEDYRVEGNLRREVSVNVKRLLDLGCYRGLRHRRGLPVRGQRTHTNARTRKGPARAIAGKKK